MGKGGGGGGGGIGVMGGRKVMCASIKEGGEESVVNVGN